MFLIGIGLGLYIGCILTAIVAEWVYQDREAEWFEKKDTK